MKSCIEILIIRRHNDNKLSFYIYIRIVAFSHEQTASNFCVFFCLLRSWLLPSEQQVSAHGSGPESTLCVWVPTYFVVCLLDLPSNSYTVGLLCSSTPATQSSPGSGKVTAPSQGCMWQQPASGGPSRCWLPLSLVPQQEFWWTSFN